MAITNPDQPKVVTVSLHSLEKQIIPLETLIDAFGPDSLGIILVRDLPDTFAPLRHKLLSLSSYLANLPATELAKLEKPEAKYALGWSHGKEKLADGRYDTLKAFYHAQPIHNEEFEDLSRQRYPDLVEFVSPNIWPAEDVLPEFQQTFERLSQLIVDIAALVARACDRYGEAKLQNYEPRTLEDIVRNSVSTKGRLLHYFPPQSASTHARNDRQSDSATVIGHDKDGGGSNSNINNNDDDDDDWCATHCDLGALTGLTAQMFVDETAHPPVRQPDGSRPLLPELDSHPDPKAGLWIKDRSGKTTQVHIPRDCLAFQTGSALELITRGTFKAVPHFVRGATAATGTGKIARNTLAVFTQPNLWQKVDEERDFARFAKDVFEKSF